MAFFTISFLYLVAFGFFATLVVLGGLYLIYKLNGGKSSFIRWMILWWR